MSIDISQATTLIKEAGANHVRLLPMPGQNILEGDYQIEVKNSGEWRVIVTRVKKQIAEQIISQALNRVICG